MEEQIRISWEAFRRTGDIEAYLLYKSANAFKEENMEWHRLKQEELS